MCWMTTLTVRIPDKMRAGLLEISSRQSVPVSDLVRESIRRYVAIERFRSLRSARSPSPRHTDSDDEDVFRAIS